VDDSTLSVNPGNYLEKHLREVIRDIETSPRGVYCGAIGYFAPDGSAAFNVAMFCASSVW